MFLIDIYDSLPEIFFLTGWRLSQDISACGYPITSPHHLLKGLSFFHWITFRLCQNSDGHTCVVLFLGSLLHWSLCLSVCQYHIVMVTAATYKILKRIKWFFPFCFLFKTVLQILTFLYKFWNNIVYICKILTETLQKHDFVCAWIRV